MPNVMKFFHYFCKKDMAYTLHGQKFFSGSKIKFIPPKLFVFGGVLSISQNCGTISRIYGTGFERTLHCNWHGMFQVLIDEL